MEEMEDTILVLVVRIILDLFPWVFAIARNFSFCANLVTAQKTIGCIILMSFI